MLHVCLRMKIEFGVWLFWNMRISNSIQHFHLSSCSMCYFSLTLSFSLALALFSLLIFSTYILNNHNFVAAVKFHCEPSIWFFSTFHFLFNRNLMQFVLFIWKWHFLDCQTMNHKITLPNSISGAILQTKKLDIVIKSESILSKHNSSKWFTKRVSSFYQCSKLFCNADHMLNGF